MAIGKHEIAEFCTEVLVYCIMRTGLLEAARVEPDPRPKIPDEIP